jgi:hypothetical protein
LYLGGDRENFVLFPIIPPRKTLPAKSKVKAAKPAKRAAKKKRR